MLKIENYFLTINIFKTFDPVDHSLFHIKRGILHGDPILAYLFILVLETVFYVIKSNKNIEGGGRFQSRVTLHSLC